MDTIVEVKKPSAVRKRRIYTEAQRLQNLQEAFRPGASVAAVARRRGVNDNMVYTWRKQRAERLMPMLPVKVMADGPKSPVRSPSADARIEIRTAAGHHIKIGTDADAHMVQLILSALRT